MPDDQPQRSGVGVMILAAGAATRMGQSKLVLEYKGLPLLQHVLDAAETSKADAVVLVTGAHEVMTAVRMGRATVVENPDHTRGNMSSFRCGAEALGGADAVIVLAGDIPDLSPLVIDQMIAVWVTDRPWGAVTAYSDGIAHPFLLSGAAVEEALATGGERLLWRLLAEDGTGRVARLAVDGPAPLDVNTPSDYARLKG